MHIIIFHSLKSLTRSRSTANIKSNLLKKEVFAVEKCIRGSGMRQRLRKSGKGEEKKQLVLFVIKNRKDEKCYECNCTCENQ